MGARNMTDSTNDHWVGITYLEPRPTLLRRIGRPLLLAIAAVTLGVGFGLAVLAIRDFGQPAPYEAPQSVAVPVEIAPAEVAPAPPPVSTPLEVLPPQPAPTAPPPAAAAPQPPAATALRADPGFDCRRPSSSSERLICGNAELAGLNRAMTRAFGQAVNAGVPLETLRQDQEDWLRVREDAAQHEPEAVAGMYRQRIAELREMAANF